MTNGLKARDAIRFASERQGHTSARIVQKGSLAYSRLKLALTEPLGSRNRDSGSRPMRVTFPPLASTPNGSKLPATRNRQHRVSIRALTA